MDLITAPRSEVLELEARVIRTGCARCGHRTALEVIVGERSENLKAGKKDGDAARNGQLLEE